MRASKRKRTAFTSKNIRLWDVNVLYVSCVVCHVYMPDVAASGGLSMITQPPAWNMVVTRT